MGTMHLRSAVLGIMFLLLSLLPSAERGVGDAPHGMRSEFPILLLLRICSERSAARPCPGSQHVALTIDGIRPFGITE